MDVDKNLKIYQREMLRIQKGLVESISNYKNSIEESLYDVPIQVLCLPENINKILTRNKLARINDLRRTDLSKIKGLGSKKIGIIQSRLEQFSFM